MHIWILPRNPRVSSNFIFRISYPCIPTRELRLCSICNFDLLFHFRLRDAKTELMGQSRIMNSGSMSNFQSLEIISRFFFFMGIISGPSIDLFCSLADFPSLVCLLYLKWMWPEIPVSEVLFIILTSFWALSTSHNSSFLLIWTSQLLSILRLVHHPLSSLLFLIDFLGDSDPRPFWSGRESSHDLKTFTFLFICSISCISHRIH